MHGDAKVSCLTFADLFIFPVIVLISNWHAGQFLAVQQRYGMWRSLVAHFVRDEGAAGSNPVIPIELNPHNIKPFSLIYDAFSYCCSSLGGRRCWTNLVGFWLLCGYEMGTKLGMKRILR